MGLPAMPATSDRILDQLGVKGDRDAMTIFDVSAWGLLEEGTEIKLAEGLFPRLSEQN